MSNMAHDVWIFEKMRRAAERKSLICKEIKFWDNLDPREKQDVLQYTHRGKPVVIAFGNSHNWTLITTVEVTSLFENQLFSIELDQIDQSCIAIGNMSFPPKNEEKTKAFGLLHVPSQTYMWTPKGGATFNMLSFLKIFPLRPPQDSI